MGKDYQLAAQVASRERRSYRVATNKAPPHDRSFIVSGTLNSMLLCRIPWVRRALATPTVTAREVAVSTASPA